MKIFKLYFKIVSRYKGTFLLYFSIFLLLTVITTMTTKEDQALEFTGVKMVLEDQDGTPLSQGLADLYRSKNTVIDKTLTRQEMVDGAYRYAFDLGVIIPKGFSESFYKGERPAIEIVGALFEKNQVLVQAQSDQYLAIIHFLKPFQVGSPDKAGEDYIIKETLKITDSKPIGQLLKDDGLNDENIANFMGPLAFMDYGMLSLALSFLGLAIMKIEEKSIRGRIKISGYSDTKTLAELLLASFLLMSVLWVVFLIALVVIEGSFDLLALRQVQWGILSSFVHMLASTSLALFCVYLLFHAKAFQFFQTVFTLLVAFASGVFVNRNFIDENLHQMASIFPTYWNVNAISDTYESVTFGAEQIASFQKSILVMVLMTAAYFVLTLILRRYRLRPQK